MHQSIILSKDVVQYILSYINKECYQDTQKKTQIRFIPGSFDDKLGYLFKKITFQKSVIFDQVIISRPKCICGIKFYKSTTEEERIVRDYYFVIYTAPNRYYEAYGINCPED